MHAPTPITPLRLLAVAALTTVLLVIMAAPALAHVELAASDPTDGATITVAPPAILLEFSVEAEPAGDGIQLLDASGTTVPSTTTLTPTSVTIEPVDELADGAYVVLWTMRAGDAHPRSGSVSFAVAAAPTPAGGTDTAQPELPTPVSPALEALVPEPTSTALADWAGRIARTVAFIALLLGLGAFMFATLVFEGSRREARLVGFWARRAGLAILLATPLELLSQSMLLSGGSLFGALAPGRLVEALGGSLGIALALRALGGVGLFLGTNLVTEVTRPAPPTTDGSDHGGVRLLARERFHVAASPLAVTGALFVAVSLLFDGHTAVTAPSWLVRLATVVHVGAAAVWVGGVAMMAAILSGRRRRREPLDPAPIALPFSTVAAVAVVLVGIAGVALAIATADSMSDFVGTPWGRALLAKLSLVGVAGAIGAHNHFTLIPILERDPDNERASKAIASSVRRETAILIAAIAVTAILVGLAA